MKPTRRQLLTMGLVATLPTGLIRPAFAAARAGIVDELDGDAEAFLDGVMRGLDEGADIFQGDRLSTGSDATLALTFLDDTSFELGPGGTLTVDEFVYNPSTNAGSLAANILSGSFRFASGKVAANRPENMTVRMPVGTIGVRGTNVAGSTNGFRAEVVLLDPEDGRPTAIQVANQHGSVIVDEPGYGTEIPSPDEPPTPPQRWGQQRLNGVLRSFRSMQRMNVPRPRIRR